MNNEKDPNDIVDVIQFYRKIWKSIPLLVRGTLIGISTAWAIFGLYSGDFSSHYWDQSTRGYFLLSFAGFTLLYLLFTAATEDSL